MIVAAKYIASALFTVSMLLMAPLGAVASMLFVFCVKLASVIGHVAERIRTIAPDLCVSLGLCLQCGGSVKVVRSENRGITHRGESRTIPSDFGIRTCKYCGAYQISELDVESIRFVLDTERTERVKWS
jgi:hypothetical protein